MKFSLFRTILIALGICLFILMNKIDINPWVFIVCSISIIVLFVFSKESTVVIKKIKIRPIHVFLLAYLIVFYQRPVDYLVGYNFSFREIGYVNLIPICLYYATIGLVSFLVGYTTYRQNKRRLVPDKVFLNPSSPNIFSYLTTLLMLITIIVTPRRILMGGYSMDMLSGGAGSLTYLLSWTNLFIIAYFIQFSIVMKTEENVGISLKDYFFKIHGLQRFNIFAYSLLILNIGDRGPLIVLLLSVYISYIMISKLIPSLKILIPSFVLLTLAMSFLGQTKGYRGDNSIFERIETTRESVTATDERSIINATSELAGSYKCLSFSVANVPDFVDYGYGRFQLDHILSVFPFVSHIYKSGGKTSALITYFIQGDDPVSGNGSSCVADFYIDGGLVGIVLGMFLFGYLMRLFEYQLFVVKYPPLFLISMSYYMSCHVTHIPRSMVFFYLKYSVWLFVILLIVNRFSLKKK